MLILLVVGLHAKLRKLQKMQLIQQFTARESKYTVTWKNYDGTVL